MIFREILLVFFRLIQRLLKSPKNDEKKGPHYPFTILNTDGRNLPGTHWWSKLNIYPKKQLFLFNSYGFLGFKAIINQDYGDIINKILYDTKKFNKKGNIVTLVTFSRKNKVKTRS